MKKKIYGVMAAVCLSGMLAAGCGGKNQAETLPAQGGAPVVTGESADGAQEKTVDQKADQSEGQDESSADSAVAAAEETVAEKQVGTEGMVPVPASELKDGVYPVNVNTQLFHVSDRGM